MRRLCCLVVLMASAISLSATAKTLPIKDWIRHPAFKNVNISPDGKYLAVVSALKNDPNRYQLVIMPTQSVLDNHPRVTAHYTLTDYETFAGVFWVNNERIAAATAMQRGGFNRPNLTGELFAINADGGQQKSLMGDNGYYFTGLLYRLPQNRRAILVEATQGHSNKATAYWLDTYTGNKHAIASSPVANGGLLADHNGDVRLAWGTNDETGWPELYYRPAGKQDWTNESKLIMAKRAAAASLSTGGPIMFGPNNKAVYFEYWADNPAETMALYSYDFDTGKKTLLYANPEVNVGGLIESFNRKSLVGLYTEPDKPEARALDPESPKIQLLAQLMQILPNRQVNITSWTKDGNQAVVYTWGDTRPGMYYLYSSKPKPNLTQLFRETPWIRADDLSATQPISFKSRDGLTIHGYLTVPRDEKAKNLPMVVYVHGGPHGVRTNWGFDTSSFDSVAEQILANHGYAVLALNYRGSGGYGFKFLSDGFRHWGSTMQNDLDDGVKWAVKQGYANPKRVCIFGGSYGGYAALMSSERFPDLFQCAIGYDGVYDLFTQETRSSDTSRRADGRLYLKTVLGTNEKQLKAFSPVFNVDQLKIPVFLLHGGRDQRAPVKGYDEMVSAIHKHGTPLKTLFEKNEGHGFYKPAHRKEAWKEILAFLDKYIGPDSKAVASMQH